MATCYTSYFQDVVGHSRTHLLPVILSFELVLCHFLNLHIVVLCIQIIHIYNMSLITLTQLSFYGSENSHSGAIANFSKYVLFSHPTFVVQNTCIQTFIENFFSSPQRISTKMTRMIRIKLTLCCDLPHVSSFLARTICS